MYMDYNYYHCVLHFLCTCMQYSYVSNNVLYGKTKHCHYTIHGLVFPFDGTAPVSVVVPVARHCSV